MTDQEANYNLFMRCDAPNPSAFRDLPDGFSFRLCGRGELKVWANLCAGERYSQYALDYYEHVHSSAADKFFSRCTFAADKFDNPVGTSYLWQSYNNTVNTVGWFRVLPEYEGLGLGRAILTEALKHAEGAIYVHTHPISQRAIKLYTDFGFKLLDNPIIGYRENHLKACLPILKKEMAPYIFSRLKLTTAEGAFLEKALSTGIDEF